MSKSNEINLSGILNGYAKEVKTQLKSAQEEVAKEGVDELKATSPKGHRAGSGKYAKDWAVKRMGSSLIIHNRKHYQLSHLLEKGHATRNGGRTRAFPHIKPVEEQVIKDYEAKAKKAIENAN